MKTNIKLICEKLTAMQSALVSQNEIKPRHPQHDKIIERVSELKTDIQNLFEDQKYLDFHLRNRNEKKAEKQDLIFLRYLPKYTLSLSFQNQEFYLIEYGEYLTQSKIEIMVSNVLNIKKYIFEKIPNHLKYRTDAFSLEPIHYEFPITSIPTVRVRLNEQWKGLW